VAGAGSIIELLQHHSGNNKVNVWGSGFIRPGEPNASANLHFFAVRGKHTQERVGSPDISLGDPGLLTPLALPIKVTKKYKLGIIPHYADQDAPQLARLKDIKNVKIINALDPVETVAKNINACELIFSSSLHGLILSDAYNIPNYWTPFSDSLTGGDYKFRDYYSTYGERPKALNIVNTKDLELDNLINSYSPRLAIRDIQTSLIKSFPA
jgi:hypothetical protein